MILPLHHCAALGCLELLDPEGFMCARHEELISDATLRQLVITAHGSSGREHAKMQACIEVAQLEGRNPTLSAFDFARVRAGTPFPHDPDYAGTDADHLPILPTHDASQEDIQPLPTTGAVEPGSNNCRPQDHD
jgi:hypothetical protein